MNGVLCLHFGHCQKFAIVEADAKEKLIIGVDMKTPPRHEPGALPEWLHSLGVHLVISGGMGQRAVSIFQQRGIDVVSGAPEQEPKEVVLAYLKGELQTSDNLCDH